MLSTKYNDAHHLRPRRSESSEKASGERAMLCGAGHQSLYLKQEAHFSSIYLSEHGNLCRYRGEEPVPSPVAQRAPYHLRTAFRRFLRPLG